MNFILTNQELVVTVVSLIITWIVAAIWKKSLNRASVVAVLFQILDIMQDIDNSPDTAILSDDRKKSLMLTNVEARVPAKKKKLVRKVFGSVGGAAEFVWKNRKMLVPAVTKLVKVVF